MSDARPAPPDPVPDPLPEPSMPEPRPEPPHVDPTAAGGALIALGMLGGAAVGFWFGEATPGFLIGTAIGIGVAVLIWLRDRRG